MYFDSLSSLIDMDGHGTHVWAAYGIGLLVILYNIWVPLLRQKQVIRSIQCHGRRTKKAITTLGRSVQPARNGSDGRGSGNEKAIDSVADKGEVL